MGNSPSVAKNTFLLYLRMGVSMIVSLYTSRVVLSALGVEDFGIYGVVGGIVSMFMFLNGALSTSTSRYITTALGANNMNLLQRYLSASLGVHLLIGMLVLIATEVLGIYMIYNTLVLPVNRLGAAEVVLHFSTICAVLSIIMVPFNSLIIANEKMNVYAYLTIFDTFIKFGIAWAIQMIPTYRLEFYGLFLFLASVFNASILVYYCMRTFSYAKIEFGFDKDVYKSFGGVTTWSLIGNLAWVGYTQGLNILLNMFFGPVVNAARSISVQVEGTIRNFATNFQTAINPRILKSYAANDLIYMHKMVFASAKYSCYLMLFFAIPIALETNTILTIWLKNVPNNTASFVRIMMIVALMETMSNSIMTSVVATGRIKRYHLYIGSLLLGIVPISYIVLRLGFPPISVFWVYAIIEFFACIFRLLLVSPMIGLAKRNFVKSVVLNCFMVCIVSVILPFVLHCCMPDGIVRLLVVGIVSIISSATGMFFVGLNKDEQQYVLNIVKVKILKK